MTAGPSHRRGTILPAGGPDGSPPRPACIRPLLRIAAVAAMLTLAPLGCAQPQRATSTRPTLLLAAFGREAQLLEERLTDRREERVAGIACRTGRLAGRPVVLAKTGVGKVNAAMTTAVALAHYRPAEVIFTGIAGALRGDLAPGDIVVASGTVHHDFGKLHAEGFEPTQTRSPIDGLRNPLVLEADPRLVALALEAAKTIQFDKIETEAGPRQPKVIAGTIATGDTFIASPRKREEIRLRHDACAVEMEGAAVAQVCLQLRTPWVIIRSISDRADERAVTDVKAFHRTAAANAGRLVIGMLETMAAEQAAPPK